MAKVPQNSPVCCIALYSNVLCCIVLYYSSRILSTRFLGLSRETVLRALSRIFGAKKFLSGKLWVFAPLLFTHSFFSKFKCQHILCWPQMSTVVRQSTFRSFPYHSANSWVTHLFLARCNHRIRTASRIQSIPGRFWCSNHARLGQGFYNQEFKMSLPGNCGLLCKKEKLMVSDFAKCECQH